MQKEKVRIFALARELGMESKDLLKLCHEHGIDVKNQLSTIEPEVRDQIVQLVQKGPQRSPEQPVRPVVPPNVGGRVVNLPPGKVPPLRAKPVAPPAHKPEQPQTVSPAEQTAPPMPPAPPTPQKPAPPAVPTSPPAMPAPVAPAAKGHELRVTPSAAPAIPPLPTQTPETARPAAATPAPVPPAAKGTPPAARTPGTGTEPRPEKPAATQAPTPPVAPPTPETPRPSPQSGPPAGLPNLDQRQVRQLGNRPVPKSEGRGRTLRPTMVRTATPPPIKPPKSPDTAKQPPTPAGPRKIADIPSDLVPGQNVLEILHKPSTKHETKPTVPVEVEDDDDLEGRGKDGKHRRPGSVAGRADRHKDRNARQNARKQNETEPHRGRGITALMEEEEAPRQRHHRLKQKIKPTMPRKGKVPVELPITVRSLSEAIGVKSNMLIGDLMKQGQMLTINSVITPDAAEALALERGCELEIKRPLDAEAQLLADLKKPDNPEDLVPRAPIVTIMGHVDHGKTSLLDKIRETYGIKSNVVSTEAGGITQVIRAWRVEKDGKPVTFLDTPGHEAFTKMRARGANVTDIAVIVVAADDGVMPQTEEAVSHAKAAGVSIVVAINKIDLPNANIKKSEQQLYGLGLIPDTMGGDVPFVYTSAAKGQGIDDLLEYISLVAEQKELKANPNKPGSGTCLEANLSEGAGVLATLLVRDGTLRRGDVILCGAAYGRVRAMYDDMGAPIQEAGPSVPVRITGLDEVPNADDAFAVVPELTTAREIADKHKQIQQEMALAPREAVTLESLSKAQIAELKVILKADFRGSIEAIRKELDKLHHEEVRVRLLHAAIGGITESDVQLALTSPEDTIIVGFNVVPDDRAHALAEERGIQIRQYNIIYQLADDIRSALEGKLKPREEIVHLGRAVVRNTFKISRVGTIAGCYVTQGVIERSARVRMIRSGVVVYPPPDRTVGLESLKRFKDDVREVREGFECGLKIAGYDDVKVDDVIEAYRIEQVQRKLEQ